MVLTNDGTLPLAAGRRVAVIGPSADDPRLLLGDYHFPAHLELAAADLAPQGSGSRTCCPRTPRRPPLEALRGRVEVVDDLDDADVAVVCVGRPQRADARRTPRARCGTPPTSGSRADQLALIEEVAATGIPVVVVVIGGRVHSLSEVGPHAAALVLLWLPGEEGGNGLADVLTGAVDASGRLPVSILRSTRPGRRQRRRPPRRGRRA